MGRKENSRFATGVEGLGTSNFRNSDSVCKVWFEDDPRPSVSNRMISHNDTYTQQKLLCAPRSPRPSADRRRRGIGFYRPFP
jgi:hypothetical protein